MGKNTYYVLSFILVGLVLLGGRFLGYSLIERIISVLIIGGLLCLISTLPLLCQSLQVVVREEKIVTKIGDNVQLICSAISERVGCSFTSPIGKFFSLWSIFIYSRWLTFSNSLANFESRLARHRFSQKTNGRICFVCFFTLHAKLYIPSTLNIALLQWHTHLNVCAVK